MSKQVAIRTLLLSTLFASWAGTDPSPAWGQNTEAYLGSAIPAQEAGFAFSPMQIFQEEPVGSGVPTTSLPPDTNAASEEGEKDELDSLLDMADKDVGKLSTVNVAHANGSAPSLQTEVTTVGRQKSTVGRSPAAVFVITNEMIQRSGARSIPDVLRMAPGVQVSRIDSNKFAISIRGSNGQFANKLLVQIDGRSVYTPLFGGVFWDVQDVLLEDVERIEVIRGPGAAVWGANAVNGVINIITKSAKETHGAFAEAGTGTEESGFASARYGWQTKNGGDVRLYGKWFDRDGGFAPSGTAHDDWHMGRMGFRSDWQLDPSSTLTVQGDTYMGTAGNDNIIPRRTPPFTQEVPNDSELDGGNALVRYTYTISEDSDWTLQAYYDRTGRQYERLGYGEDRDTIDFDFQHRMRWMERHSVVWGAGYRNSKDNFKSAPFLLELNPPKRSDDLFSLFVQDEIMLMEDLLYWTAGAKFLHNDYTQFEFQPTTRLLLTPTENHSVWAAYSRAVRLPTRVGDDVRLTLLPSPSTPGVFPVLTGDRDFQSENLNAWELGFRAQTTPDFSWDIATFYFDYDDVQSNTIGTPTLSPGVPPVVTVPLVISNNGAGKAYGFELGANYQLRSWWRLSNAYTFLREDFEGSAMNVNNAPRNQIYAQSSWDLKRNLTFDLIGRYMDNLVGQQVPSYTVMDVRMAWNPTKNLQWSIVGRNLLDSDHPEFGADRLTGNIVTNVQRELYTVVTLRY